MINKEKGKNDSELVSALKRALLQLEERGDIVLCSSTPDFSAHFLGNAVGSITPSESLTSTELVGLRSLILYAINDESFFDWEMPTLTGLKAEQFQSIAKKLPKE